MTLANRESFEKIYRYKQDVKTKERMLLVLNVVYQGKISAAHVAKDLHRSKSWASDWLKRYDKRGVEGLKTRPKSGRPSKLSEEIMYQIKKELKESNNQGWRTTKQVEELIIKKSGIKYKISLYSHIPVFFVDGALSRRCQVKVHVNTTASLEEKEDFKKRLQNRYLWISILKNKKRRLWIYVSIIG